MNILASRFRKRAMETEMLRKVAAIVLEVGAEAPRANSTALPGDQRRLRGIPVLGGRGSLGGAIAGTRPGDGLDRMS